MQQYESNEKLRDKLIAGINKLVDPIASTLGPRGRTVILYRDNKVVLTKDGVTIAKSVMTPDAFENIGAQVIRQASETTANSSGDGTTTAAILARAIFVKAQKYILAGASPHELKKGIDKAVEQIVKNLEKISKPISSLEDIVNVASISANNDRAIGELVAKAVDAAGIGGAVTIEEARSLETSLETIEGFQFDSGIISTKFVTDERKSALRYENALVLVTNENIDLVDDIIPVLTLADREKRPLVIIAENVEGQALASLIMNTVRGSMKVAAIKAPRYGEERKGILEDLAISIGATFFSMENGNSIRNVQLPDLGRVQTIEATKYNTIIVGGNGESERISERVEQLKETIKNVPIDEAERIQERITRLAASIAIIRVGGLTEVEMIERKHRIEDALEAVRSASSMGVVPGGGIALIHAAKDFSIEIDTDAPSEDQLLGADIMRQVILEPLRQMAINAGKSADVIVDIVKNSESGKGYDFLSNRTVDMLSAGILDPCKVTISALQNAASAATTLITSNYAIAEV